MLVTIRQGNDPSSEIQDFTSMLQSALEKAGHRIVEADGGYEAIIFLGYHPEDDALVPDLIECFEFGGGFIIYHPGLYTHSELFDLTEVDEDSEVHNCTFATSDIAEIIEQLDS